MLNPLTPFIPWLIGAFLAAALSASRGHSPAICIVFAGAGGFLAYEVFAFLISASTLLGISPFNELVPFILYVSLFMLVLFSNFYCKTIEILSERLHAPVSKTSVIFLLIPLAPIFLSTVISTFSPVSGWDSLDFWANKSARLISHFSNSSDTPFINKDRWGNTDRHPMNISSMLAWEAYSSGTYVQLRSSNLLAVLSAFLVLGGTAGFYRSRPAVLPLVTYAFLTVPLIENHISLIGYSEVFIAVALLISVCLIALGLSTSDQRMQLAGCFISLTCIGLKNTGFIYASLSIIGFCIVQWFYNRSSGLYLLALTGILCLLIIISLYIGYRPFVALELDQQTLWVAGKQIKFLFPDLFSIFNIEITSKVVNISFSLCAFLIMLAIFQLMQSKGGNDYQTELLFLLVVQILGFLVLFLSLFTHHGYSHALPTQDTGHSRFAIPVLAITPCLVIFLVALAERKTTTNTNLSSSPAVVRSLSP